MVRSRARRRGSSRRGSGRRRLRSGWRRGGGRRRDAFRGAPAPARARRRASISSGRNAELPCSNRPLESLASASLPRATLRRNHERARADRAGVARQDDSASATAYGEDGGDVAGTSAGDGAVALPRLRHENRHVWRIGRRASGPGRIRRPPRRPEDQEPVGTGPGEPMGALETGRRPGRGGPPASDRCRSGTRPERQRQPPAEVGEHGQGGEAPSHSRARHQERAVLRGPSGVV